ncbi:cytochrome P450 [Artemisia annua]|uniref:Cytochrome P450 n=1 Tax=Artemisia annua TaxID=35608 RepID=A0A2U1LPY8_ARTAN|nr:cytochrome P450 [Artemisia annua]
MASILTSDGILHAPRWLWRLQQILRMGKENKLSNAWKMDQFICKFLDQKQNEYYNMENEHEEVKFTFFTALVTNSKVHSGVSLNPSKFLRDYLLNMMAAGKGTMSKRSILFFYLLATNPIVEDKVLQEIHTHLDVKAGETVRDGM